MGGFRLVLRDPLNPEEERVSGCYDSLEGAREAARNTIDEGLQLLWEQGNSASELIDRYRAQYFYPLVLHANGEVDETLDASAYLASQAEAAVRADQRPWAKAPDP